MKARRKRSTRQKLSNVLKLLLVVSLTALLSPTAAFGGDVEMAPEEQQEAALGAIGPEAAEAVAAVGDGLPAGEPIDAPGEMAAEDTAAAGKDGGEGNGGNPIEEEYFDYEYHAKMFDKFDSDIRKTRKIIENKATRGRTYEDEISFLTVKGLDAREINGIIEDLDVMLVSVMGGEEFGLLVTIHLRDAKDEKAAYDRLAKDKRVVSAAPTIAGPELCASRPYLDASQTSAEAAWSVAVADSSIIVAVLDIGFNIDHPQLSAVVDRSLAYNAYTNTNALAQVNGHGTEVAGMITTASRYGTSYGARLMPVQIGYWYDIHTNYISPEAIVRAFEHIREKIDSGANIKVINMSFAGYDWTEQDRAYYQPYIDVLASKGVLCVAGAGNDNSSNPAYPASLDKVLSVAALNAGATSRAVATDWGSAGSNVGSSYGPTVDIAAPGTAIETILHLSNGTSLASPIVAGIAALVYARFGNVTPANVEYILKATATPLGDYSLGAGRVDAMAAVTFAYPTVPAFAAPANGLYTIAAAAAPGKVLDVRMGSVADGAGMDVWRSNNTPAQRFRLEKVVRDSRAWYRITCVKTGKRLDVPGGAPAPGRELWQHAANDTDAQLFGLVPNGSGYWVVPKTNPMCALDLRDGLTADGTSVQVWGRNATAAQRFTLAAVSAPFASGVYSVRSALDSGKSLDVAGNATANATNVHLWDYNGSAAQRFAFSYDAATGYYAVIGQGSGKAVDVWNAEVYDGANVQIWDSNGTWAQRWTAVRAADGSYVLYCATGEVVMDLAGASTANGANVQIWAPNGSAAQRWWVAA
jgi:hypothetical protein